MKAPSATTDRVRVWHLPTPVEYKDAYRVATVLRTQGVVCSDPDPVRDSYGRLLGYDIKYIPKGA